MIREICHAPMEVTEQADGLVSIFVRVTGSKFGHVRLVLTPHDAGILAGSLSRAATSLGAQAEAPDSASGGSPGEPERETDSGGTAGAVPGSGDRLVCACDQLGVGSDDECIFDDPCPASPGSPGWGTVERTQE